MRVTNERDTGQGVGGEGGRGGNTPFGVIRENQDVARVETPTAPFYGFGLVGDKVT